MRKKFNIIINILIVITIILILLLVGKIGYDKYLEFKANKQIDATYQDIECDDTVIKENISKDIFTNVDAKSNKNIGYIYFPSVDKKGALVQGDDSDEQVNALSKGTSHDPKTPMPGESGNTVIAGHREMLFKAFKDLEIGDNVVVNINDNIFVYEITNKFIIEPDEVNKVFIDSKEDVLTMYTCYPIEAWKAFNKRMVIQAKRVKQTKEVKTCQ